MNLGYVFLIIMASAAYFVAGVPTPDKMIADFDAAQKFYTSGAYDQAVEKYQEVGSVQSRFLDVDNVLVSIGDITIKLKDATLYQTANSYAKMAENELNQSKTAEDEAERERDLQLAREYVSMADDYFNQTQDITDNRELQQLSQKRIIDTWYLITDYDKVIEEGRDLISRYPQSSYIQDALYNIGWAYFDTERYEDAIITFRELITRFPTGNRADRALYQIGECYFEEGDFEEAAPNYQQLVDKMRINEMTELEIQKIQRDKLAGIITETSLDLAAKAALKVGQCYANSGDYTQAEDSYKRIASLFSYDMKLIFEAYFRLANMYKDLDNFEMYIRSYRDAIDDVQDRVIKAQMQVQIAQGYYDAQRYDEAIQETQLYINSYSDVAFRANFDLDAAFMLLGRAYYDLGTQLIANDQRELGMSNIQRSVATFERIFTDFPATTLAQQINFRLAISYQELGDEENVRKALALYDTIMTEYPDSPYEEYIYVKMARVYRTLGDNESAVANYNRVIERFPDSPQVNSIWFELGVMANDVGDKAHKVEYLLNVHSGTSESDKQLYTTARLLAGQSLYEDAEYQRVVDALSPALADPSSLTGAYRQSQMLLLRGNAYKFLNRFDNALQDYTTAYNLEQPETQQIASVQRAGVYIDQQQYAQAENDLRELMESEDDSIKRMAQMRLAIISVRQGKSDQAIQTYYDLYQSTEDVQEKLGYLRNLIQLTATAENWDQLDQFVNMMIDSDEAEGLKPEGQNFFYKEEAYYFLATSYETRGRQAEEAGNLAESQDFYLSAVDYYLQGFETFKDSFYSSDMLLKIGVIYLTKLISRPDALEIAANYFEMYITEFPDTPNAEMANYYLGFCYYNGRFFDEANRTFRDFAAKYPQSEFTPEAVFYYSDSEYNAGDLDLAIEGFDRLISRYPNSDKVAEAIYTKAWAYLDLEQEQQAIATFQELVDRFPQSEFASSALFSIADYYYNNQEYQLAYDNYQKVLADYPETEVAQKVPETLKDLSETIAYIEYEKGWNLFTQAQDTKDPNLYNQAIEIFSNIVANYPNTESEIGAYSNLGICYEGLNRWRDAIDAYDSVIQKYEEGGEVSEEAFNFARMHKDYIVANML